LAGLASTEAGSSPPAWVRPAVRVAHTVAGSCGSGGSAASTAEETPFDPVDVPPVPVDVLPVPVDVLPVPVDVLPVPVDVLPVPVEVLLVPVEVLLVPVEVLPGPVDVLPAPDEVVLVAAVLPLELELPPELSPPPHAPNATPVIIDTHSSFIKPGIVFSRKIERTGTSTFPVR